MPSILNVSCPVCKIVFKNADTIYSTSCGHIFHFNCLNDWKSRSTTCPQCRDYNPTTHRIYLNFDENIESTSSTEAFDAKIETLERNLGEKKIQYQELRSDSEKNRKQFEGRINELMQLIKKLKMDNQTLEQSINAANKTAKELSNEKTELKLQLECKEEGSAETLLREQIKVLEQKLKHITNEFQKEISSSTQLAIDKMKLQSYFDSLKLNETLVLKPINKLVTENVTKPKRLQKSKKITTFDPSRSVVIHNYPLTKMQPPLENVIILIAAAMGIFLTKEEIKKVVANMIFKHLYVEFIAADLKLQFISHRDQLKNNPYTRFVKITEYSDDNIRSLFTYANTQLRGKVFGYIAIKGNTVICKRNQHDIDEIEVISRTQVDDLLKQHLLLI